jgi:tetratricopeptide (TPR) repeat protein
MSWSRMIIMLVYLVLTVGSTVAADGDYRQFYRQGVEFNKQGAYAKAIEQYSKAIALKKDSADLYYVRGRAYRQNDQLDKAISDLSRAIVLKPDYAEAYNHRGVAYISKGEKAKAMADFQKSCSLKNQNGCANVAKFKEQK